jgi:glycosyltransferase involved in cell wall biosynthesis
MEQIVALKNIPNVVFAGFQDQTRLARAYAASDVFVLPSIAHETWGIVVNEAMNFSLPIVATDKVGSARDLVKDGDNGFIVPAGDVGALAGALGQLVGSPELRSRLGARSLRRITDWHFGTTADGVVQAAVGAVSASKPKPWVEDIGLTDE